MNIDRSRSGSPYDFTIPTLIDQPPPPTVKTSQKHRIFELKNSEQPNKKLKSLNGRATAITSSTINESIEYLRLHGSDEEIKTCLRLNGWTTEGFKDQACSLIISCFRNKSNELNLSNLEITSLPNCLQFFPWLKSLNLSSNPKLRNLFPVGRLVNLNVLLLQGCDIHTLSFLKNLTLIQELSLSGNRNVNSFAALKSLKHLEILHLQRCNLKNLTFLRNLSKVKHLSLDENSKIFSLLPLRNLIYLQSLSLKGSSLRNLTPLKDLPRLEWLFIYQNPHFPGLNPSSNSIHIIRGKSSLGLLRSATVDISLQKLDLRAFIESQPVIVSWLHRITNQDPNIHMPTWQNEQSRPALAEEILKILQFADNDPVFLNDILLPLINDSMTSCIDRTTYYLNEMVRSMELYQTKDKPLSQAIPIFQKYYSLTIAKELARESAGTRGLLHEEIEVQLDFFKRLNINLPFLNTLYTELNWIEASVDEIEQAKETLKKRLTDSQEWISYLCLDSFWQKRLFLSHPELQEAIFKLQETKYEQLETLLSTLGNDLKALQELEKAHKQQLIHLLGLKTQEMLGLSI